MTDEQTSNLIRVHLGRYADAQIMDVYKLLHQATFGPGHLISNKRAAREFLEQEIGQLRPVASQALVENVHPDGAIVRLHLRPYMVYASHVRPLLDAFIRSAGQVTGDPATMAARWEVFTALAGDDPALRERFPAREVQLFGVVRAREKWPAISHSPTFNAVYRPRYRVLTASEAEQLCERIGAPFEVV